MKTHEFKYKFFISFMLFMVNNLLYCKRGKGYICLTILLFCDSIIIMIKTFSDKATAAIFSGQVVRRIAKDIQIRAQVKLLQLDCAKTLDDLKIPPGNRLEALKGDRQGQYNIRVNKQYSVCFNWDHGDAFEVEITDYNS